MVKLILILHLVRFGANIRYKIIILKVSFKEYLNQKIYRLNMIELKYFRI